MGRKSLTRKQIKYYEEPLVRGIKHAIRWVVRNYLWVLMGLALALAGGFGWITWRSHQRSRVYEAQHALDLALQSLHAVNPSPDQEASGSAPDVQDAEQKLKDLVDRYPGSLTAAKAAYHLGQLYLMEDRPQPAADAFRQALDAPEPLRSLARFGLAQALAAQKKYAEAMALLDELEQDPNPVIRSDWILYYRGLWLLDQGKTEAAHKVLRDLITSHPDSPLVSDARKVVGDQA